MSKENWGMGGVYLRNKIWWIHYSVNGRPKYESSKSTDESKARKLLKKRLRESGHEDAGRTTVYVDELLDGLLDDYRKQGQSIEWATMVVEKHLRPVFQYLKAQSIGSDHIKGYINARLKVGRSNATVNRELALLRRAFSIGSECKPPKCRPLFRFDKLREDNVRSGFFEESEMKTFREALPIWIRPVLTFAYYTGCRRAEILGLRWDQVDIREWVISLEGKQTKNRKPRIVPLNGELRALLTELKAERDANWPESTWVFSHHGRKILSFGTAWHRARVKTGIQRIFHDTRRTGVRNLVRAGVPEKVAMLVSGHLTRSVFDRYQIVTLDELRGAMDKLDAANSGRKETRTPTPDEGAAS